MMAFNKKVDEKLGDLKMEISGFINEKTDFGRYDYERLKSISISCGKVELVSSTGILIWINWFKSIFAKNNSIKVYFFECPKVLIDQMNQVKKFLPLNSFVKSFYAPYYCETCGKSKSVLIDEKIGYRANSTASVADIKFPKIKCESCDKAMEADYAPQKYFHFFKYIGLDKYVD